MKLPRVHDRARQDVEEIAAHIAVDQLLAAIRFCDAAEAAFNLLAQFPGAGPVWEPAIPESPGLRFWPIKGYRNYLVLYRMREATVEVIRVDHGARDIGRLSSI
jgi:toxin ParE1/3/4